MSKNTRQIATAGAPASKDRPGPASAHSGEGKSHVSKSEFSWYGGKVDETIVREIVRLKREQKL